MRTTTCDSWTRLTGLSFQEMSQSTRFIVLKRISKIRKSRGSEFQLIVKHPEPSSEDNFGTRAALDLIQNVRFVRHLILCD